jgi:hypothetical protein
VSPAMICPLPKVVQTKKWNRTSKRSDVLSSSPYKNALRALRKEPSSNRQGSKTFRYDGPSVASTCSAAVEEEKINCSLRTACNVVGVNNGGMKTVQATKAWDSSNARCANAHSYRTRCAFLEDNVCKSAHLLFVKKCYFAGKIFNFCNSFYVFCILED